MHTNGNGTPDTEGIGARPVVSDYRSVWWGDDPAMVATAGLASHVTPRWPLRETLFYMLNLLKWGRRDAASARWAIEQLFEHTIRQQRDVCRLEEEVRTLRAEMDTLLEDRAERTRAAVREALEDGEDVEAVIDRLREPVTKAEEQVRAEREKLAEMEASHADA